MEYGFTDSGLPLGPETIDLLFKDVFPEVYGIGAEVEEEAETLEPDAPPPEAEEPPSPEPPGAPASLLRVPSKAVHDPAAAAKVASATASVSGSRPITAFSAAAPASAVGRSGPPSPSGREGSPARSEASPGHHPEGTGSVAPSEVDVPVADPYGYGDRLLRIEEQYVSSVSAANDVESYLLHAYEVAQEADERYLAEMDDLYTPMWRKTGLPQKASKLALDRTKLHPLGLLNSKALVSLFQRDREKELGPPQTLVFMDASEENKGYYKLTKASLMKQRFREDEEEHDTSLARSTTWAALSKDQVQSKLKEAERRRKELSKRMPAEQWEQEKKVLRRMKHTLNFLRNPRFAPRGQAQDDPSLGSTAHSVGAGPGRPSTSGRASSPGAASVASTAQRRDEAGGVAMAAHGGRGLGTGIKGGSLWSSNRAQREVGISVHPSSIEFHDFEPGVLYEAVVVFKNHGSVSRRLRILPPYSQYFTVSDLEMPRGVTDHGLVAPGMSCSCVVRFSPDSRADVDDTLTVMTDLVKMEVPLVAVREPPMLSMEGSLDVGACFVGNSLVKVVTVKNVGGKGRFRIIPETYATRAFPQRGGGGGLGGGRMGRGGGGLGGGGGGARGGFTSLGLDDPTDRPVYAGAFSITPWEFVLEKDSSVDLSVCFEPDEVGKTKAFLKLACDNCESRDLVLRGEACEPVSFLSHIDGREPYPGEVDTGHPLFFGEVCPGGAVERTVMIRNDSKLPLRFEWRMEALDADTRGKAEPGGAFDVSPRTGYLIPKDGTQFTLTFRPPLVARLHSKASLWLSYGSDTSAPCDMPSVAVELEGLGRPIEISAQPPVIFVPGPLTPGQAETVTVQLVNTSSDAPARFFFPEALVPPGVGLTPMEGVIPPDGAVKVQVRLEAPAVFGQLVASLQCSVRDGVPLEVPLRAEVTGPDVGVGACLVDFGLVQARTSASQTLRLTNRSQHTVAAYRCRVQEAPPPVQAAKVAASTAASLAATAAPSVAPSTMGGGADRQTPTTPRPTSVGHQSHHRPAAPRPLPDFGLDIDMAEGTLQPGESRDLEIVCQPTSSGSHRALVWVEVPGRRPSPVLIRADALEPQLALDSDVIDLGTAFVGIDQSVTFWLKNLTQLAVRFRWDELMLGDMDRVGMTIMPMHGTVKPGGSYRLKLGLSPARSGPAELRALCHTEGSTIPLALSVRASVQGLNVSYEILEDLPLGLDVLPNVLCPGPNPVFDFGNAVRVGETRTQVLVITNNTGIDAPFMIFAESFGLQEQRIANSTAYLQALTANSFDPRFAVRQGSPRNSATRGLAAISGRAPPSTAPGYKITLGDDQEQRGPFRSDLGKTMMKLRRQAQDSESVLGAGKGLAIEISPSEGVIPPFKEARIRVTCHSNMYGTYTDTLHSIVGDLPEVPLPLRIGVIGTPLVLHKNRRLIRGLPSQPLHDQTYLSVSYNDAVFGAQSESRTFYVFNTSPMDMEVEWEVLRTIVHEDLPDDVQFVECRFRSTLGVISVDLDPLDYTYGKLPNMFTVEPRAARIAGGSSASFTARFVPPRRDDMVEVPGCRPAEATEVQHWGMLVGKQRLVLGDGKGEASIGEGTLKLVTWTHGQPRPLQPHSKRLEPGFSVKEAHEEGSVAHHAHGALSASSIGRHHHHGATSHPAGGAAGSHPPSSSAAAPEDDPAAPAAAEQRPSTTGPDTAGPPEEPRVQCIIRGSMHPFAGPPDVPLHPLRVALNARNIGCTLVPAESGLREMHFMVHANLGPSHPTFMRAATFTNTLQVPMVVAISAKGELSPFSIIEVIPSVFQDPSLDLNVMTPEGNAKKGIFVPPRENVEVSVRFTEPEELEQSVKDYKLHGHLQMVFQNGDIQKFPLDADVVHPELLLSRKDLDFGVVHVKAPKQLRIVLTNPTKADCRWEAVEKDQKPRFKDSPEAASRIGPFVVSPSGGVIQGRGLAMPKTQTVTITYMPTAAKFEDREITFAVFRGRPADLYASGEGSYDERLEFGFLDI